MKKRHKVIIYFLMVFSLLFISTLTSSAAKRKKKQIKLISLNFKKIKGNTRSIIQGSSSRTSMKELWGKVSCVYDTNKEWLNEIELKYYVLVFKKPKNKKRTPMKDGYLIFSGKVTYLNVPAGKKHLSNMYIHPYTLKRFGDIKEIRIEAWYNNNMVSSLENSFSSKKEKYYLKDWVSKFKEYPSGLMRVNNTPFIFDGGNALEQIKK